MSEENKPEKKIDLSKLRAEPILVELEGRKFEVTPVTVGLMMRLSNPSAQETPNREAGLQALQDTLRIGGEAVSGEEFAALSEESQQQLAARLLEISDFTPRGGDALESLGAQLKDCKSNFPMPASLGLSEMLTAQLDSNLKGILSASAAINAVTSKWSPETKNAIDFASSLRNVFPERPQIEFDNESFLKAIDPANSPQGRAAKAAETTAAHSREMLTALGEMLQHIGGLTKSMLGEALPQWLRHIETAEQEAKESADRARKSLNWAIGSVIVSILATFATTAYDYSSGKEDAAELAARAGKVEVLLQEQIGLNRKLLELLQQQGAAQSERIGQLASEVRVASDQAAARSAEIQEQLDKLSKQNPAQNLDQKP